MLIASRSIWRKTMENNEDYSYLEINQADAQVLSKLKEMGEHLKELKMKQLLAEEEADKAKKAYEHFANVIIPAQMHACGVDSITLSSGGTLSVTHKFYCQPNKNPEDRKKIYEWLKKYNGEHLLKKTASVASDDISKLTNAGIPFIENNDVNTQSLKSFIKSGLGLSDGPQQFDLQDIPECIHFQEVSAAEIIMPK